MVDDIPISAQATKAINSKAIKVWDILTRVFHWALVVSFFLAWLTMNLGWLTAHKITGYFILFLLLYRILWGLVGSSTARFTQCIKGPREVGRYLRRALNMHDDYHPGHPGHPGHNPAGAWMVLVFLLVLLAQVLTGLFANNDLGFAGPLADSVLKETSDFLTRLHGLLFNVLLVLTWLHLVAVLFYVFVKGQNLVLAMITGKKPQEQAGDTGSLFFASSQRALLTLVLALVLPLYLFLR